MRLVDSVHWPRRQQLPAIEGLFILIVIVIQLQFRLYASDLGTALAYDLCLLSVIESVSNFKAMLIRRCEVAAGYCYYIVLS